MLIPCSIHTNLSTIHFVQENVMKLFWHNFFFDAIHVFSVGVAICFPFFRPQSYMTKAWRAREMLVSLLTKYDNQFEALFFLSCLLFPYHASYALYTEFMVISSCLTDSICILWIYFKHYWCKNNTKCEMQHFT